MSAIKRFPINLLETSNKEKISYFRNFLISHPSLNEAYTETFNLIKLVEPGTLIFVYGPAGVGKTTLLKKLEESIYNLSLEEIEKDRMRIPVVKLRAPSPDSGNFSWRDYYRRLLIQCNDPFVNKLKRPKKNDSSETDKITNDSITASTYRYAVEQNLRNKKPWAVLVDDAHHINIIGSGRKTLDQLNTLKCIGEDTKTTHVFAGTYDLLVFRNLSGQVNRRSIDIHLKRYSAIDETDRIRFVSAVRLFQFQIPLHETPDLIDLWDYLYERSLGCIGVLKDWLERAFIAALNDESKTLKLAHLERRAPSIENCKKMLTDILEGEKRMAEREGERQRLRKLLGLSNIPSDKCPAHIQEPKPTKQTKKRVGKRKPVRDKTGNTYEDNH